MVSLFYSPSSALCRTKRLLSQRSRRDIVVTCVCCCPLSLGPKHRRIDIKLSRQFCFLLSPLPQSLSVSFPSSPLRPRDDFNWRLNSFYSQHVELQVDSSVSADPFTNWCLWTVKPYCVCSYFPSEPALLPVSRHFRCWRLGAGLREGEEFR